MTTRKTKSKAVKSHPEGYRVFMSGFAEYARENGIHVRGQRGAFAKKASQVWHDLKSKPSWKENLDVILPQYLEGTEGAEKIIIRPEDRLKRIAEDLGGNQFEWWNIKSLFGLWIESPDVFPEKDRLFVVDANNKQFEISTDENSFSLYRMFKDEVDGKRIDEYSYVQFEDAEINNKKGIDLIFTVNESTEYRKKIHDKTTYDWDEKIKERYGLQKEAIGEKGVAKLARGKFKVSKIEREELQKQISSLDIEYEKEAAGKLKALNEAINRLETQYANKIITKTEYKKYLNILYKL
jgi:hypothetical protein